MHISISVSMNELLVVLLEELFEAQLCMTSKVRDNCRRYNELTSSVI